MEQILSLIAYLVYPIFLDYYGTHWAAIHARRFGVHQRPVWTNALVQVSVCTRGDKWTRAHGQSSWVHYGPNYGSHIDGPMHDLSIKLRPRAATN